MVVYLLYFLQGERGAQGPQGFKVTCWRLRAFTRTWESIPTSNRIRQRSPLSPLSITVWFPPRCHNSGCLWGVYILLIFFIAENIISWTYSEPWARLQHNTPEIIYIYIHVVAFEHLSERLAFVATHHSNYLPLATEVDLYSFLLTCMPHQTFESGIQIFYCDRPNVFSPPLYRPSL